MRSSGVLVLLVLVGVAGSVFAQSSAEPRAYVGGGLAVAWQPEESEDGHYLMDSTVGGTSPGFHVVAGIHLAPSFSLCGEWSKTGSVSGTRFTLQADGIAEEAVEHRESVLSVLFRWHPGAGRVSLQPVGGPSWVFEDTTGVGVLRRHDPSLPPEPWVSAESITRFALTGGADVAMRLSDRFQLTQFFGCIGCNAHAQTPKRQWTVDSPWWSTVAESSLSRDGELGLPTG
jgi:hypothetical protein